MPERTLVLDRDAPATEQAAPTPPTPRSKRSDWTLRLLGRMVLLDGVLYSFTWARLPGFSNIDLPVQRIVVWATLLIGGIAALRARGRAGELRLGPLRMPAVLALLAAVCLPLVAAVGFAIHYRDFGFETKPWLMDVVKYATSTGFFVTVFFALRWRAVRISSVATAVMVSSALCIAASYGVLIAYLVGFRWGDDTIFRAYGDAFGVWPTGDLLPRLVGPSTEPQQLSIVFVTGLLLMVRSHRRSLWALAAAGLGVLVLSQSKFALASCLAVVVFAVVSLGVRSRWTRRAWGAAAGVTVALLVGAGALSAQLPIFAMTLRQGVGADAVQERLENAQLLTSLIREHLLFGIGSGQYGIYRGFLIGTGPDPTYYPNNDYLKVFAELGLLGFLLLMAVLSVTAALLVLAVARRRALPGPTMPFAVGAALVLANMTIGYELLHVFLWMNLAVVLFCVSDARRPAAVRSGSSAMAHGGRFSRRSRHLAASALVLAVVLSLVGGVVSQHVASAAVPASRMPAGSIDDGSSRVRYEGDWRVERSSGPGSDARHWSGSAGAVAQLAFHGGQVAVYGDTGPAGGIATVSVDGGPAYEVDFYRSVTRRVQLLWVSAPLPGSRHSIRVEVSGTARDDSSGHSVVLAGFRTWAAGVPVSLRDRAAATLSGGWHLRRNTASKSRAQVDAARIAFRGAALVIPGALSSGSRGTVQLDGGPSQPIAAPRDGTLWSSGALPPGRHAVVLRIRGAARMTDPVLFSSVQRLRPAYTAAGASGGWKVYAQNPVIGKQWGTAFDLAALQQDGGYRVWFSWRPKAAIAFVESVDGVSWTAPRVVLAARPGTWESDVNRPAVVVRPDGTLQMWYTGQDLGRSAIGTATSRDGVSWTRVQRAPVLVPNAAEQPSVMNPSVLWDSSARRYKMWFSEGQTEEPNSIGYATSADGRHWTRYGGPPVLQRDVAHPWERDRVAGIQVIQQDEHRYLAFYIGYHDLYTAAIGTAHSVDGVHWTGRSPRPIVSPVRGTWNCDAVYKPFALYDATAGLWRLWFNGRCAAPEQLGLAVHRGLRV